MLEGLTGERLLSDREGRGGADERRPSGIEFNEGPGLVLGIVTGLLGRELGTKQVSLLLLISVLLVLRNSFNFSLQIQTKTG